MMQYLQNNDCIVQMIADEKIQMIADISNDICDHLASFNLCQSVL